MKINNIIAYIIIGLIIFISIPNTGYAYTESPVNSINNKIDKQNEEILERFKNNGNYSKSLETYVDIFRNKSVEERNTNISLKGIKQNIINTLWLAALTFRKLFVWIYVLTLFAVILLTSIKGAKSLKNRKKYIMIAVSFSVIFLILMNLPIIFLYYQTKAAEASSTPTEIYRGLYNTVMYLKQNSVVFTMLLVSYGTINLILGKNDLTKRTLGKYLIKLALIVLIAMQTIPTVLRYVI